MKLVFSRRLLLSNVFRRWTATPSILRTLNTTRYYTTRNPNEEKQQYEQQEEPKPEETKTEEQQQEQQQHEGQEESKRGKNLRKYEIIANIIGVACIGSVLYYLNKKVKTLPEFKTDGYKGVWNKINFWRTKQKELLLDPIDPSIPEENRKPTLVINLEDLLVYRSYTPQHGWKTQKRPGLDEFLKTAIQLFEVVIFSDSYFMTVAPILEQLDPYQQTTRLFSDKLNFKDGHYVKDLSLLGRPLDKVVMIEHNPDSYHGQESNLIKLKPWKGDVRDRTLYDLITFLRWLYYESDIPMQEKLARFNNKEGAEVLLKNFKEALKNKKVFVPPPEWFEQ